MCSMNATIYDCMQMENSARVDSGADPGIGSGGGGTGEGVAGGGAKLEVEPPRGGCGRGAPLPPS